MQMWKETKKKGREKGWRPVDASIGGMSQDGNINQAVEVYK